MPNPFSHLRVYAMRSGEAVPCPTCGAPSPQFVAYYGNLTRFLMRCDCGEMFFCSETPAAQPARRRPVRAAVVEPHADTRELYCAVLMHHGVDVMSFASAEAGMRAIPDWRPALVSTELWLPDCDGLDFCRQLRRSPDTSDLRIAIVTGETRSERLAAARELADVVLVKPCPVDEYLRHLTRLARTHRPRRRPDSAR